MSKKIDTSLLDKAINFAVNAHKGIERKGKGLPYIVHPIEAVSICATMTNDQELLAASALHDVIEDTDYTYEDLKKEFGKRVADLVQEESDVVIENVSRIDSWHERKKIAMDRIKNSSHDAKIVAMSDKLSNMRAIARDYFTIGDSFWNLFHVTDPVDHEWHYRGLADSLSELSFTYAYREFIRLIDEVFTKANRKFSFSETDKCVFSIRGNLSLENIKEVFSYNKEQNIKLDMEKVGTISFGAIRYLLMAKEEGRLFVITNASRSVADRLDSSGASKFISVFRKPYETDIQDWTLSGEGHTALSYNNIDGDSMMKLYRENVSQAVIEQEKRISESAFLLGIPTPMTGEIILSKGKLGCTFERIVGKKSVARAISENPDNIEEYISIFASLCKKLHSTPCDKSVFPSFKDKIKETLSRLNYFTDDENKKLLSLLEEVEDKDTCMHGDLHIGNVVLTDSDALFIDMGDFCFGNPIFDFGAMYVVCHFVSEDYCIKNYHINIKTVKKIWEVFIDKYFAECNKEERLRICKKIERYSVFQLIGWCNKSENNDFLIDNIKKLIKDSELYSLLKFGRFYFFTFFRFLLEKIYI